MCHHNIFNHPGEHPHVAVRYAVEKNMEFVARANNPLHFFRDICSCSKSSSIERRVQRFQISEKEFKYKTLDADDKYLLSCCSMLHKSSMHKNDVCRFYLITSFAGYTLSCFSLFLSAFARVIVLTARVKVGIRFSKQTMSRFAQVHIAAKFRTNC